MKRRHHRCFKCRKPSKGRCRYCGNYFCKEDRPAKTPGMFKEAVLKGDFSDSENYRENGHGCPDYYDYLKAKQEHTTDKEWESLERLRQTSHQPSNKHFGGFIHIPHKKGSKKQKFSKHYHHRPKENKTTLTAGAFILLSVILIGFFVLYQNPGIIEDSLSKIQVPSSTEINEIPKVPREIVQEVFIVSPERKEECRQTFDELNNYRKDNGRNILDWDERAYSLAVARSKDMFDRDYFDHVTPEGTCAKDFQSDYGFSSNENLAENVGGMSYYYKGSVAGDCSEALNWWITSRGHNYNLLYPTHTSGAIGCYNEICTFFGVNTEYYGLGYGPCSTGDEGLAYWETAPLQPGEIS